MIVRLRPMREDEFPAFAEAVRAGYAEDIERNGRMPRQAARRKAERDCAALFSDGLASAGQSIYVVEDGETGERVGVLWLAERELHDRTVLWIYNVEIDERLRGRGLGRQTMMLAEDEARARGIERIELNVFGGNEAARNLYRSLGYDELAVQMGKDLGG